MLSAMKRVTFSQMDVTLPEVEMLKCGLSNFFYHTGFF